MTIRATDSGLDGLSDFREMLQGVSGQSEKADRRAYQQAAVLAFGQRASAQPPTRVLMQDAIALVAEVLEADLSGVGELIAGEGVLSLNVAANGAIVEPIQCPPHREPTDPAASMAGWAVSAGQPVVSADLAAETRFCDRFLRRIGVVSAMTLPLHARGKVFGVLGVYQKTPREFSAADIQFAETICHLLASSMVRASTEEELFRQRALTATVLDNLDCFVLILDTEERLLGANPALLRATQFTVDELRKRPLCEALFPGQQIPSVRSAFRQCACEAKACRLETGLLTKDGGCRQVAWSFDAAFDESGKPLFLLLAGLDRTDQLETEKELHRARHLAKKATEAFERLRSQAELRAIHRADAAPTVAQPDQPTAAAAQRRPFVPESKPTPGAELRSSRRWGYCCRQKIAPIRDKLLPTRRDFREVECRDISASGIAFYLDIPPDFEDLVVLLGSPPAESCFMAHVVRCVTETEQGRTRYLVGCRFTGRVRM